MRFVRTDKAQITALSPAFGAGEIFGWEKGDCGWGAAEDGVGVADSLFEEAGVVGRGAGEEGEG